MKKVILILVYMGLISIGYAQKEFNQWSIETNIGFNKAMSPLAPPYLTPTLNVGHFDVGARYMINEKFGIKGIFEAGSFSNWEGKSPDFKTNYMNLGLVGVANLGRIWNFESFTRKFGFLGHFGTGVTRIKYITSPLPIVPEYSQVIKTGITGLFKFSQNIALSGKIEMNYNSRQDFTFDGSQYNTSLPVTVPENPRGHATGVWWVGTLGLNFYLGSKEQHADWYIKPDPYLTKDELASQISSIKDMLKDSDGDGIPDYLDKEPNTPADARVGTDGVTLDSDGDGLADHLDKCPFLPGPAATSGCPVEEIINQEDYLKKAIQDNYVNVYFAFDSSKPLAFSISSIQFVSNFLKRNPGLKLEVRGYADEIGPENYNLKLSEKRAQAVHDLLIKSGIDAARLTFKGYGEDTSVDKNSENARQMARRTSFEIK
ncbi:OmpA-OmpF porin, OOP family [Algoriphagus ornithinivorans]|uniref:OmpA-OmpF porin, OOP family n=1 Tax=Algoriphagus ornithinivorans TaxID=226506 RepID=A0A1I5IDV9_9BACT|nr:OmpA family protein [Algoriphagus ornithinivorans]SFO58529.1 OmpA-OmpF porin, OOP family [Algoriphagus ornithinivorans]